MYFSTCPQQKSKIKLFPTENRHLRLWKGTELGTIHILYTPISIPYKAYTGALWYWRWKCWGAAGSHKSKHLE